ncbi:hypothetical protein BC936DRAFT_140931 [Jimgerdemannia flammicorona]|uniref:Uncharacterized protein n=1 Tax=Jimgerdemannia flammicorona TaxID=994334 RepID=A0A433DGG1_9FUNG|nr:hypothetical protein BC936DRAFT_140931 [Jimgerdemannia flammicorona]
MPCDCARSVHTHRRTVKPIHFYINVAYASHASRLPRLPPKVSSWINYRHRRIGSNGKVPAQTKS